MTRKIVAIVGALAIVIGVYQIVRPDSSLAAARAILGKEYVTALGLPAAILGIVFLVAGLRRLVRISLLVTIIGGLMVIVGAMMLAHPGFTRSLIWRVYLGRSHSIQMAMTVAGGVIRSVLGTLLLYAGIVPPRREEHAAPIRPIDEIEKPEPKAEG